MKKNVKKFFLFITFFGLIIGLNGLFSGCSRQAIMPQVQNNYPPPQPKVTSQEDSTAVYEKLISEELKEAETYYAAGVEANQQADWLVAQSHFEKALDVLGSIDLGDELHSKNIDKYNRLLHEIATDYKITLLSLGTLDSAGSISSFWEKFDNIQDFQKLRDSTQVAVSAPDTSITYDMPIEWNQRVEDAILYLQTVSRERFELYLFRSGKYLNLIKQILKERNLPMDLAYLPMIESGFSPKARSWANAVGMWQFIPSTGRLYGLKSNWWYDEKKDFIKATYAACDYLSKLYNDFGSWHLALAAYNCGEGSLSRRIKRSKTDNYWELNLRKQTYDYVPLYMAATIIAKDPQKYGFDVEYDKPLEFDTVQVDRPLDLKTVADILNVSLDVLRDLNPELLRDVTPPQYSNYPLRIPTGTKEFFSRSYSELPAKKLYAMHRVKKGETVSSIAKKYGVSPFDILQANSLSKKYRIYPGDYLKIPGYIDSQEDSKESAKKQNADSNGRGNRVLASQGQAKRESQNYQVRPGDTLTEIADKFNTDVSTLKQANGIRDSDEIKAGDTVRVPAKAQAGADREMVIHKVRRGETLWSIANNFRVSIEKILEWNSLSDPSHIQAGDIIKIFKVK
ncbi:MAG TPA: LysM peptidoglycan-binding domain-containing protein [Terriglobales bacterium]|nr:LysM peptidoglycan-binding domain-containing protein [Terriglobales bacterium]